MVIRCVTRILVISILITWAFHFTEARGLASTLRSVGRKVMSLDYDSLNLLEAGPQFGSYAAGAGLFAFRSGVISSLCQLDRGEKEAAMETLRVTIASITMETTQTFGLPIMSMVIDKMVNKYGAQFPRTIRGFKDYNRMLGSSILDQVNNAAAPQLLNKPTDVLDQLDTLKGRMKTDFADEVTSFLKTSSAYDDLVKPLQHAKKWAKVAKWADFLLGPIFDAANIAFTGWQLHQAVQADDNFGIASGSLGIVGSIVGIGSFVVGSLATAGSILAVAAGPIGAIIGCILTLASLIIDIIATYDPSNTINRHLELVRSLTAASKDMLGGSHKEMLERVTSNGVNAGFGTLYEVNQAMLIKASISDPWKTIKGFNNIHHQYQLVFKPDMIKQDKDFLVVGKIRVFDKKYYQNWMFKPKGREEIGYTYYGKEIVDGEDGMCVRLNTDMVTNQESNMWFWLNGAEVTTYATGQEEAKADDNINIGDFRTLWMTSARLIEVNTGGGDDLIQITGVICAAEQQKRLKGKCFMARMGSGFDMISFAGMDTREEKLEWYLDNNDLSKKKPIIGIAVHLGYGRLSYRLREDNGSVSEVRFGGLHEVEGFIGSPLDDVVRMDDTMNCDIKQSAGDNIYELYISPTGRGRQYVIEDNSDTPGHLKIYKDGLEWQNIVFCDSTSVLLVMIGSNTSEVFLKRCKPGINKFRVSIGKEDTKELSEITTIVPDTGILKPFVPYPYRFDKSLTAQIKGKAFVELLLPTGDYSTRLETYTIKFKHTVNKLILSPELLDVLRNDEYTFKAHRDGRADADARWSLVLKRRNPPKSWKIKIIRSATIMAGPAEPNEYRNQILHLPKEKRNEVNIFHEYRTIMNEDVFKGESNFTGTEEGEKLVLKYSKFDPESVLHYIINMKGPLHPTETNRNEIVIDDNIILGYTQSGHDKMIKMELERASKSADWHLKMYSTMKGKVLRLDITLKGVHVIIAGPEYSWKLLLNLTASTELTHDLNDIIINTFGRVG